MIVSLTEENSPLKIPIFASFTRFRRFPAVADSPSLDEQPDTASTLSIASSSKIEKFPKLHWATKEDRPSSDDPNQPIYLL